MPGRFAKRVVAPVFFPVPAGAAPTVCRSCRVPVYEIETAGREGKSMTIDCQVVGGRQPTGLAAGSGVSHWIYCTAPARDRTTPREYSPL